MTNGRDESGTSKAATAPRGASALAPRLTLAFLGVALATMALLAILTAVLASADVRSLASRQRAELTGAIAVAAGASWQNAHSWTSADLSPVLDLAADTGAEVQIRDNTGHVVDASLGFGIRPGLPQYTAPVLVHGVRVGTVLTRFTGAGLSSADDALQTDLFRAIGGAAGLAALVALLAGLGLARRITRPVERIIAVTRAMSRGERTARVGQVRGPAELSELGMALDRMADTLDRQEQIRRDMVADVAHELRTPVAVLQAGHEAILDGVTEPTPEQLASLRDEVLRLGRMVSDLQDMAAADAAALHLALRNCDLADVAAEAADSLAARFEAADIRLERDLAPAPVLGDPRWLHQVVMNLLTNALKYTPTGGNVAVHTSRTGQEAVLTVADTGIGIPADELPQIFDRFWRGRQAAQTSGTGIGLAIAAELTQAHGGQLAATSEPGRGTEMTLTLPAS
jgi:two-component system, OmpR family, sensor histidine kinase BaeS